MRRVVSVMGAGAWGTALAAHAARSSHDVRIWAREPEVASSINERGENALFLEGIGLPRSIRASTNPAEVLEGADIVVLVAPSQHLHVVASLLADRVSKATRIVIASKGIQERGLLLMTDVVAGALPGVDADDLCALSGPSFAKEVASGLPTDVVVASKNVEAARDVASAFHTPMFRVYTSIDPIGVEIGGALKNVLAIAAGVCDGLGLGMNARAALMTRGLSEMARFGVALGGDPLTFLGLSGVGDLILTSTGALSRNRALGIKIAEGVDAGVYVASQRTVAEGYSTARAAYRLAQKLGIDAPITEQVYMVLHEGRPLLDALKQLMTRAQKDELSGIR